MPGRAPSIRLKRLGFAKVGPGGGLELSGVGSGREGRRKRVPGS